MRRTVWLLAGLFTLTSMTTRGETLLLSQPALGDDVLVFVYAGDLWATARNGANPRRLTASAVDESHPRLSPDGRYVAYRATHENNADVYVISIDGGQPERLTWHPGVDTPLDWTANGREVVFASQRELDQGRSSHLYHVARGGGFPVKQHDARIYRGRYDPAGRTLAFIAFPGGYDGLFGGSSGWRGYRGGRTPAIQLWDLRENTVETIPGARATNFNPLWTRDAVLFISDRNDDKVFNLFRYDRDDGSITQISRERRWDVRSASVNGTSIVYEAGGQLKFVDVESRDTSAIEIEITADLPQRRVQWKDASRTIQWVGLSPSAQRAIVTARGDVFTVPLDKGSTRNLTQTDARRELSALWAPTGEHVGYLVESRDGQSLVIADQFGAVEKTFELGEDFYSLVLWTTGDDDRIVFTDNHLGIFAIDTESGEIDKIVEHTRMAFGGNTALDASPDGRWLAYAKRELNFHRDIVLYDFETKTHTRVTDGTVEASSPAFGPNGKYLYFTASTNAGPVQVGLNMTSQERPVRAGIYALALAADGATPLAPTAGDEPVEDPAATRGADAADEPAADESSKPAPTIDLDGLRQRIVPIPIPVENYIQLDVAHDGSLLLLRGTQPGGARLPPNTPPASRNTLLRYDFEARSLKPISQGIANFSLSHDRKHLIASLANGRLVTAKVQADTKTKPLDTSQLRARIDPANEWAQIFDEAWRREAQYFYDANMHGLDWDAVYRQYRPLLDHVGRREDLNTLLVAMIAELQVGHNRAGGGDVHTEGSMGSGLLGANLEVVDDRYRVSKVYSGEVWNPFFAAPLAQPGNRVNAGEFILAIDGVPITAEENIHARLQGTIGRQVTLGVAPVADAESRNVVVTPIANEGALRLWDWVESNRRYVDAASDGKVGYVYLPNTAGAGYTFFNRMFYPQVDRAALIVDERGNGGGQAANYITEVLSRPHLSGWAPRDGATFATPAGAFHGPKVMLIDQDAGSGGDYLPWSFRYLGIGKLVGTRTWGGLIGVGGQPLIDGGFIGVPYFRYFDPDGEWTIENEGVAPDIAVDLDPIAADAGRDSQLDRALEVVLSDLADHTTTVRLDAPPVPTELGR